MVIKIKNLFYESFCRTLFDKNSENINNYTFIYANH